jgi:hypothetical protein
MKSVFRKVARELVIFVFVGGIIGACIGIAHEFEQSKPLVTILPDAPVKSKPQPNCVIRAPGVKVASGEIESCQPWVYYNKVKKWTGTKPPPLVFPIDPPFPCAPRKDAWEEWHPEGCHESAVEIAHLLSACLDLGLVGWQA